MKFVGPILVLLFVLAIPLAFAQQSDHSAAHDLFNELNASRAQAGLPPLVWDDGLAQAAVVHSERMLREQKLSHQFSGEPDLLHRVASYSVHADRAGENVAMDYSAPGANEAFLNSPPHRENMLSPNFNSIGIGIVRDGKRIWVTEDFAHRMRQVSESEFESGVLEVIEQARLAHGENPLPAAPRAELRRLACEMGSRDQLQPALARSLPNVRYTVAATLMTPSQLAPTVTDPRSGTLADVHEVGVGSCFERTQRYPSGVYFTVVVFYQNHGNARR